MECNLPYNPSLAINFSFTLPMAAKKKKTKESRLSEPKNL